MTIERVVELCRACYASLYENFVESFDMRDYDTGFNAGIDKAIKTFIPLIREASCPSLVFDDSRHCGGRDCETCKREYYTDELMTDTLKALINGKEKNNE